MGEMRSKERCAQHNLPGFGAFAGMTKNRDCRVASLLAMTECGKMVGVKDVAGWGQIKDKGGEWLATG